MSRIVLKEYDYDKREEKEVGEVSTYILARSMKPEDMTELLDEYVNQGMKDYRSGENIGKLFQTHHRSLQGSLIRFCLGIIIGLSKQEYTDARNEVPVAMGKELAKMIEYGDLKMGILI